MKALDRLHAVVTEKIELAYSTNASGAYRSILSHIEHEQTMASIEAEQEEKDKELQEFVLTIDAMTTSEFCKFANINTPQWQGSKDVAVMDFLTVDAKKWNMVKDKAKEIARRK